jgi:muramoyltetrapeptide carboxypeptidase
MCPLKPLEPGDLICIISPAGWYDVRKLDEACVFLSSRGFRVSVSPQSYTKNGQYAGTDRERAVAVHEAFSNRECKAIFCAKGGYGTMRILDLIDFELIRQNPRILVGFSDVTCLLNEISERCGFPTFHGPMVIDFAGEAGIPIADDLLQLLAGRRSELSSYKPSAGSVLRDGESTGIIAGGNLTLVQTMIGTAHAPSLTGRLFFFEEVNEALYRVDRTLNHLRMAGQFKELKGVLIGESINIEKSAATLGRSESEVYRDFFCTGNVEGPVVMNMPFGHGARNLPLPLGWPVTFRATPSRVTLDIGSGLFA